MTGCQQKEQGHLWQPTAPGGCGDGDGDGDGAAPRPPPLFSAEPGASARGTDGKEAAVCTDGARDPGSLSAPADLGLAGSGGTSPDSRVMYDPVELGAASGSRENHAVTQQRRQRAPKGTRVRRRGKAWVPRLSPGDGFGFGMARSIGGEAAQPLGSGDRRARDPTLRAAENMPMGWASLYLSKGWVGTWMQECNGGWYVMEWAGLLSCIPQGGQ